MAKLKSLYLFFFLMLLSIANSFGQQYGNEWINYNQQYFKIPIVQTGFYRITQPELQAAGFPTSIDPRKIQIFKRGVEQAINFQGEADGTLDPGDYLEFYGERNDGTLDAKLYIDPAMQVNKYYNIYSDTSAYFLTFRIDNIDGKRMANIGQQNTSGLSPVPYHIDQKILFFANEYFEGQQYPIGDPGDYKSFLSQFDTGEGFVGTSIVVPSFYYSPLGRVLHDTVSYIINNITNTFPSALEPPQLTITFVGKNNLPNHNTEVLVGGSVGSLRSLAIINYPYSEKKVVTLPISWTDIVNGILLIKFRVAGTSDWVAIANIELTYPQGVDAGGSTSKKFIFPSDPSGSSDIEIDNPPSNAILYDFTDINNIKIVNTFPIGNKISSVITGTDKVRAFYLNNTFRSVSSIRPIGFRNINPLNHNFLIISHKGLRNTSSLGYDAIKAYSDYRASAPGGAYDTITVNIDMIYNQFSYGEKTPLAITHFADFMLQNQAKQHYMFLIGRGKIPFFARVSQAQYDRDFIPPAGFPASDVALVSGIRGNNIFTPAMPIGRLVADTPEEVISYLNKIKEHEALEPQLWQKNLLHLSGGKTASELPLFRSWVDDFKNIVEGKYFGGKVATISKKTDNPVEFINVADQVNKGLSMITFFGHASTGIIDIDIGYASNPGFGYQNKGKYPMVIINGCDAGDVFSAEAYGPSFGENWIKTPDKGAILFYAHSYIGYSFPLKTWGDQLYSTFYADSSFVGKSIGLRIKEAARKYSVNSSESDNYIFLVNTQQYILQGDPSIVLTKTAKPDYSITSDKIFLSSFNNQPVTAAVDSFRVGMIVENLGRVDSKNFGITIRRTFSNGTFSQLDTLYFPPVFYRDTVFFTIKNPSFNEGGNNKFEVIIDPGNFVNEYTKLNNIAVLDYLIPTIGAIPLIPREYSVVSNQPITFIAQATGLLNTTRQFIMEIDTAYLFNSSTKRNYTTTAASLPTWSNINLISNKDSVVYYWRVRYNDIPEGVNNTWAESSFIFINNSPEGWSQTTFHQFIKAGLNQLVLNVPGNKWEFAPKKSRISLKVYGRSSDPNPSVKNIFKINNVSVTRPAECPYDNILAVAFDKNSSDPYAAVPYQKCGHDILIINAFPYYQNGSDIISTYIDAVKDNDYFLIYTNGYFDWPNLPAASKAKLINAGADINNLNKLQAGDPYIFLGRKNGGPGSAIEVLGDYTNATIPPIQQIINLDTVLNGRANQGTITSSIIGPASEWGNIWRNILPNKNPSTGSWSLDLLGIDLNGNTSTVLQNIPTDGYSINNLSVNQYPYLKLKLNLQDTVNQIPPQLHKWQVIYKGVPEGIYNADLVLQNSYKIADKMEGESFSVPFVFQNISKLDFSDSLTVQATIFNKTTGKKITKVFKIKKLTAGDTVNFSIPIVTSIGSAGNTVLQVFVNPRLLVEQNYANNYIEIPFNVTKDNRNPILEVTFDGIRIMNGDIVSPTPLVNISLKDDNKVQIRKDTAGIEVYLKRPCENTSGCNFERISLSGGEIKWSPAGPDNNFRMEYRPAQKLPNGIYTLKVQGRDVSGNLSGYTGDKTLGEPYQINFEVINESTVTHFYPYPNPFSTSTRFVFTLTGSTIPDQIKIQVMTVTGKVVREIMQDEIGPIRIGNNITQYAWNGTDEFGDQLANGVYFI